MTSKQYYFRAAVAAAAQFLYWLLEGATDDKDISPIVCGNG